MYCSAVANGDAVRTEEIYWNMPLRRLWGHVHCWFIRNGTKVRYTHGSDDIASLLRKFKDADSQSAN